MNRPRPAALLLAGVLLGTAPGCALLLPEAQPARPPTVDEEYQQALETLLAMFVGQLPSKFENGEHMQRIIDDMLAAYVEDFVESPSNRRFITQMLHDDSAAARRQLNAYLLQRMPKLFAQAVERRLTEPPPAQEP